MTAPSHRQQTTVKELDTWQTMGIIAEQPCQQTKTRCRGTTNCRTGELEDEELAQHLRGRGLCLITEAGTELLDAASGTFNLPLGYDHPHVLEAIRRQTDYLCHVSSHFAGTAVSTLADRLVQLAPDRIGAAWIRDATGSTAAECAVKIAQKATGKADVVSLFMSHHGQTIFTTAISGNAFRRANFAMTAVSPHSIKVPGGYCYRCFYKQSYPDCNLLCVTRIDDFLAYASSGSVAALVIEPVMGNGGNITFPPGYLPAIRKLCDRHDIILIADEVQTGLGRTGYTFASDVLGLDPDIVILGKALGGIGIPLAAVLMRPDLDVLEPFEHSFTSGGNFLGVAAAHALLDIVASDEFLADVRRKGKVLGAELRKLASRYPCVGDARGIGYMWGIEIVDRDGAPDPALAAAIVSTAEERHRLIVRQSRYGFGNVVKIRPALIATEADLAEILIRLERSIADCRSLPPADLQLVSEH